MENPRNSEHRWMRAIKSTLDALIIKLRKYYKVIDYSFIYSNSIIFQSRSKLVLFKHASWEESDVQKYSNLYRERYLNHYEFHANISDPPAIGHKRSYSEMEDEDNEYEIALQSLKPTHPSNEYDRYIQSSILEYRIDELNY